MDENAISWSVFPILAVILGILIVLNWIAWKHFRDEINHLVNGSIVPSSAFIFSWHPPLPQRTTHCAIQVPYSSLRTFWTAKTLRIVRIM